MPTPKVVLANGVFDLLHYGHLLHFQAAKELGDLLVVSITDDASVAAHKGRDHPVYPAWERSRLVLALKPVDDVIIVSDMIQAMEQVKPDILVKGIDYKHGIAPEHADYCKAHGIEIVITDTPKYSAWEMIDAAKRR